MAFTSMLEARIRIKYGQDVGLSSQFTLDCNWLTEGCQGGWGILAGFFTDFFHIVSDMCVPYTGTTGTNCQNYKHCEPVARTLSTYFVGGKYGQKDGHLLLPSGIHPLHPPAVSKAKEKVPIHARTGQDWDCPLR